MYSYLIKGDLKILRHVIKQSLSTFGDVVLGYLPSWTERLTTSLDRISLVIWRHSGTVVAFFRSLARERFSTCSVTHINSSGCVRTSCALYAPCADCDVTVIVTSLVQSEVGTSRVSDSAIFVCASPSYVENNLKVWTGT